MSDETFLHEDGRPARLTERNQRAFRHTTLRCESCDSEVVVKWRHYLVVLLAVAGFFTLIATVPMGVTAIALLFVALGIFISVYQIMWLPLSRK